MSEVIPIYIGCDANDSDLEQMMVLEYSLRKHASMPLDLHWMRLSSDPASFWYSDPDSGAGWHTERWATPFSGFRWAIAAHRGFKGRAIYLDADILALCDIAELFRMPFAPGKVVMAKGRKHSWRFCVAVWDCARAAQVLPPLAQLRADPHAHENLIQTFSRHPGWIQQLDTNYNNVDGEGRPLEHIRLLHYSDMGTQFSHSRAFARLAAEGRRHWFDGQVLPHPRADLQALFDTYYDEALAAGYRLDDYRNPAPARAIVKASQAAYEGNRRTRHTSWLRRWLHGSRRTASNAHAPSDAR